MQNLQPYFYRKDDDGHDYFIPPDLGKLFDELLDKLCSTPSWEDEWYDLCDVFEHEFGQYRTGKSFHDVTLWINPIE